ncbi:MAG: hypothetical protein ACRC61_12220 [Aeromonas salmonicida]
MGDQDLEQEVIWLAVDGDFGSRVDAHVSLPYISSFFSGQSRLDDGLSVAHGSPPKPLVALCLQDVNLAGRGFGGLPIANRASWEDEHVGLLGMRHDDAKPNNYCTAVGAFCLLHEGPMSYPLILCGHRWIVWGER